MSIRKLSALLAVLASHVAFAQGYTPPQTWFNGDSALGTGPAKCSTGVTCTKTDGKVVITASGGGGGSVTADAPLTGDGTSGSHLACAVCVATSSSYANPSWITSLAASKLTGTLAAGQFPALTGDATTTAGSLAVTLATSGVTAASYGDASHVTAVTFDAKGRATTAASTAIAIAASAITSGTLPIARGGTNSASALSGSSIMASNGSAIVQGPAGTTTTLLHGNASGLPTYSAVVNGDLGSLGTANVIPKAGATGLADSVIADDGSNMVIGGNSYLTWEVDAKDLALYSTGSEGGFLEVPGFVSGGSPRPFRLFGSGGDVGQAGQDVYVISGPSHTGAARSGNIALDTGAIDTGDPGSILIGTGVVPSSSLAKTIMIGNTTSASTMHGATVHLLGGVDDHNVVSGDETSMILGDDADSFQINVNGILISDLIFDGSTGPHTISFTTINDPGHEFFIFGSPSASDVGGQLNLQGGRSGDGSSIADNGALILGNDPTRTGLTVIGNTTGGTSIVAGIMAINSATSTTFGGAGTFNVSQAATFNDALSATKCITPLYASTATATVANTGTETTLVGSGTGSTTLPASYFAAGQNLRIQARGVLSTKTVTPGTIRIKIYKGSTVLLDTTAATVTANLGTVVWTIDAIVTGRSATTVIGQSGMLFATGVLAAPNYLEMSNGTSATTISSSSEAIDMKVTWGTADTANTISCTNFVLTAI